MWVKKSVDNLTKNVKSEYLVWVFDKQVRDCQIKSEKVGIFDLLVWQLGKPGKFCSGKREGLDVLSDNKLVLSTTPFPRPLPLSWCEDSECRTKTKKGKEKKEKKTNFTNPMSTKNWGSRVVEQFSQAALHRQRQCNLLEHILYNLVLPPHRKPTLVTCGCK